jgi:hypothetical protein
MLAPLIAAAQVTLGIYTVLTMRAVPVAVAHFAGATALWGLARRLLVTGSGRIGPGRGRPAREAWSRDRRCACPPGRADVVALVKPNIAFMALLTAAGGMSLAPGEFVLSHALVLLLGTALIVGAANTLNMYLERDVDRRMARTKDRPLPASAWRPSSRWRSAWCRPRSRCRSCRSASAPPGP